MRRFWRIGLGVVVVAGTVTGCGDEAPTEVGSGLLGEELRTVQVVLDHTTFLQGDTTYDQIGALNQASYGVAANQFEGELDANLLFQVDRPDVVTYEDDEGDSVSDTIAAVQGAHLRMIIDTLSASESPISFEVVELTESWHASTVTWDVRVDTADVAELWTTPGGTAGAVLATATWSSGDTVTVSFDSAAAAVLDDTTNMYEGAALRVTTADKRLRIESVEFEYDVRPQGADTVVTAGRLRRSASVAPEAPAPATGVLRIGGLPVWRSMLHFQPLDDLMVPCDTDATACEVPLSEVTVNTANLIVRTRVVGGRRMEGPMQVESRAVLEGPTVPLTRSPLSRRLGIMADTLETADFLTPADVRARIPITGFVERNAQVSEGEEPLLWLALTAVSERSLFGYGEFGGLASTTPPQLELVVTFPVQKVTP